MTNGEMIRQNEKGWKKGDVVVTRDPAYRLQRVIYLADSELDYDCFIGEDVNGDISDDWIISDFHLESEENYD